MLTSADVVLFLRDRIGFNILLDEVQFDTADIEAAIRFSISEFNAMTPVTTYTEATFPNEWLLLVAVAAHLMSSEAFLQVRNQATFQDGGVNVKIGDSFRDYMTLRESLKREWKEAAQKMKQQANMESCFGSLSSGYSFPKRYS